MTMVGDGLNSPRRQGGKTYSEGTQSPFPDKYIMRNTRILRISKAQITEVPMEVLEAARQELVNIVSFEDNWLREIPKDLHMLSELLNQLILTKNQICFIPTNISQYSKLSVLNLSGNLLCDLPMELGGLKLLRELDISHNRFDLLPRSIYELESLESLLANDNKIKGIDASPLGLYALPELQTLNLKNNDIQIIPPVLGNMRKLQKLELWGNPFRQPRHQILSMGTQSVLSYLRTRIPI
ncbi:leucine-rich repeat-containing protein 40 [Drosophila rhopaloa]|uniref:Leucine-rich repeat-containing protein 40 n=1 Tax=Drosophila rhopaloa TaxID=1041015 RepID=A0A6P4E3B2_DRORH|nr:leucine-rich repeat-containing protein 40 [Drosophila rhopaloa]XP_016972385.1 leucine-rich repeat-containing protein 40 [Drosophila rhopaloa]XP_016972387.1 leucine-rich repeat-containing protein 40 [Drosophila rhopaloa]